jgi:biopolymer transport protein ExbB/TolQ
MFKKKIIFFLLLSLSVYADVYSDYRTLQTEVRLKKLSQEQFRTPSKKQSMEELLRKYNKSKNLAAAKSMAYKRLKSENAENYRKKEDREIEKNRKYLKEKRRKK